jgi:RNA polymerase sigma factor (TIGR02999 family)
MGTPDTVTALLRDLRRVAHGRMRRERRGHTLQTDALVHEAWLRLAAGGIRRWRDGAHLLALARRVMQHVLVDHARARGNQRRGGDRVKVPIEDLALPAPQPSPAARALEDALQALAAAAPRQYRVVEMRFFEGRSVQETALALQVSGETVMRDWHRARRWLRRTLQENHDGNR